MPRVGIYSSKQANAPHLEQVLMRFGFRVSTLGNSDLAILSITDFDALYLPGGWYQFDAPIVERIQGFVREGGGCVGSCCGSILVAGQLALIRARVLNCNIRGRIYLEPQQGEHDILKAVVQPCKRHDKRRWEPIAVTHLGGPLIVAEERDDIIASYDTSGEVGAIVAASYGAGRAVAIASHPELKLANVPDADYDALKNQPLPQGDTQLLIRNATLWATGNEVPEEF